METRRLEVIVALVLLVGSLIGWPLSALTVAASEPPFVLGLSWFAITLTAADLLKTSRVHRDQDATSPAAARRRRASRSPAVRRPRTPRGAGRSR